MVTIVTSEVQSFEITCRTRGKKINNLKQLLKTTVCIWIALKMHQKVAEIYLMEKDRKTLGALRQISGAKKPLLEYR